MTSDPGAYGRTFAAVYDDWYPLDSDTAAATAAIRARHPPPRRLVEVGVGTGRIAIPLAEAGYDVVGVDSSEEMLTRLTRKLETPGGGVMVRVVRADARYLSGCADGSADVIVAGLNLVFNLLGDDDLGLFFRACRRVSAPGGVLVVQTDRTAALEPGASATSPADIGDHSAVVTTTVRADGRVVDGMHQVVDADGRPIGEPRRWSIRPIGAAELDTTAQAAGWVLDERLDGWDGNGGATVSWYRTA